MERIFKDGQNLMKRIILLYQYSQHSSLVINVCKNMNEEGLNVDALNIKTGDFFCLDKKTPVLFKLFRIFMLIPKVRVLLFFLIKPFLRIKISSYDIADIHFLSTRYDKLIPYLKRKGVKIKVMFWGSDFYRISEQRILELHEILKNVDLVHVATKNFKDDILKKIPEIESKITIAHFGLNQLEILKEMIVNNTTTINSLGFNKNNKIIVTCGYNGSEGQQHLKIINSINKLDRKIKDKIYLVFPMTYGIETGYLDKLEKSLKGTGLSYKFILKRLSLKDLLTLRLKSDIVINIQVTDAFSASLQEHIMSGNIMILGDWLPYSILDDNKVFTVKTSLESLTYKLNEVINNISKYKKESLKNREKMYNISSWIYLRKKWADMYKSLM